MDAAYHRKTSARRIGIFIFDVLLHALITYALVTVLTRQKTAVDLPPIEVRIIRETPPMPQGTLPTSGDAQPKPAVKQRTRKPRPSPPPQKVRIRKPSPLPSTPAVATTNETPPPATIPSTSAPEPAPLVQTPATVAIAPAPRVPIRTTPMVDSRYCNKPEYPSASRRFEETGTVVLNFLIETDGRVVQSRIESSSGYQRLDEAARQALSLCRFKPGTVDGRPERSWHRLQYVWKLDE